MSDIEKEILAIDDKRYKAMVDKDYVSLDKILADTLRYTHSTGRSENKAEYMAMLTSGKVNYSAATRQSVDMTAYGNTVVCHGKVELQVFIGGENKQINSMYLNVWVKGAQGWQMVAWASTPLPKV
jgi:ketosteroid isomerase-like protein